MTDKSKKKRTDIYAGNAIARLLKDKMPNAKQKIAFGMLGISIFADNKEIDEVIKLLNSQHKEMVEKFKALKKK